MCLAAAYWARIEAFENYGLPARLSATIGEDGSLEVRTENVARFVLEVPAGLIDQDEPPEAALRRELHEELGVEVGTLTLIATFYTSPGFSSEQIFLFATEVIGRAGEGGGLAAEGEALTVRAIPREAFYHATPLYDAKTLLAREWARARQWQQLPPVG